MINKKRMFHGFRNSGRIAAILFAVLLAVGNTVVPAYAADQKVPGNGEDAVRFLLENRAEQVLPEEPAASVPSEMPEQFDLRDRGVVTPVKFQNPYGTCWGFAAIAAAETSILSEMGKTYEETKLDLSEHHLAYFARVPLADGSSQDGEGVHMLEGNNLFDTGGSMVLATSLFSSGVGVVSEERIPYRGKESMTESFFGMNYCYSAEDDWTIPSEYEFLQEYPLESTNVLRNPAVYAPDTNVNDFLEREKGYIGYDAQATEDIKKELYAGKAVSICFSADTSMPGQTENTAVYLNNVNGEWAHYTYDGGLTNHAVTIVGWDDTYPASNFLDHSQDPYGDGTPHQPEGNGAWIVKNSWGAETEEFPNMNSWGVKNADGKSTGYFYISYYDRSLEEPETFDFDVTGNHTGYIIDQYDYMQAGDTQGWVSSQALQTSNIFTAEFDEVLKAVACETNTEDTEVLYQVYLLDEDGQVPDDGQLAAEADAFYEYGGFHQCLLDSPVMIRKGQRYSIVVTQMLESGGTPLFAFCEDRAENKEAVEKMNLDQHRSNHGVPDENLSLWPYYTVGIVNPGESFVYINDLGQWFDMADVIPKLQETEEFEAYDFDNFSIKAYLDFPSEEEAKAAVAGIDFPELNYAAPAGSVDVHWILTRAVPAVLGGILLIILFIVLLVKLIKKKRKQKAYVKDLETRLAAAEGKLKEIGEITKVSSEEEIK